MEKENRRIKMTKMLLNDSFLKLLEKRPLARVTVKDICDDADLNRSTYYRYYTDPYDQIEKLKSNLIEEMFSYIDTSKNTSLNDFSKLYSVIKKMLDYMQTKKDTFRILLSNNGDISLQKDLLTVFAEKLLPSNFKITEEYSPLLQKYIFICNGSFGMIYYWLITNVDETTDELAKQITTFIKPLLQS